MAAAEQAVAKARAAWKDAKGCHEQAVAAAQKVAKELEVADREAGLVDLESEVASGARAVTTLVGELETARAELEALRGQVGGLRARAEAQRSWASLAAQRAELDRRIAEASKAPAPAAAEDLGALDQQLAAAEAALVAGAVVEQRAQAEARVKAAEHAVADADLVAQVCGPKGARVQLLARALVPFLEEANAALALLATGYQVDVDTEGELSLVVRRGETTMRPAQLSDGERTRVLAVLQYAVTVLAGVDLLVLDRIELADDAGRAGLKQLAATAMGEGIQVLMLTSAPAPAEVPAGVVAYHVQDGAATRIPEAAKSAAPEVSDAA